MVCWLEDISGRGRFSRRPPLSGINCGFCRVWAGCTGAVGIRLRAGAFFAEERTCSSGGSFSVMRRFGRPIPVMELELHEQRPLARAEVQAVMKQLGEEGYYLQMPPQLVPDIYHGNLD